MDGNIGNVEFDGDATVVSNGGNNGVGCEYLGGYSGVHFFAAFVDMLAFFMGLPLPPPQRRSFLLNLVAHCGIVSGTCYMLDIVSHFSIYYTV